MSQNQVSLEVQLYVEAHKHHLGIAQCGRMYTIGLQFGKSYRNHGSNLHDKECGDYEDDGFIW